jgi:putative transposase
VSAKFEFIDAQKADFPIVKMCEWAEVSTSGYYEWRDRPASATAIRREHLKALVKAIFKHSDQTYGYRRVHAHLVRQGEQVSPELVRELMRELDLVACQPRPYRPTTTVPGDPGPISDLVNRDFTAAAPGQKMVGDITCIPTWEGWLYLATVIDCHTKACIGYAMADHLRAELVIDALRMAARNYPLVEGAIFHSDRGTQYTSAAFAATPDLLDIRRSVNRLIARRLESDKSASISWLTGIIRGRRPNQSSIGRIMLRQCPRRILQRRRQSRTSQSDRLPHP